MRNKKPRSRELHGKLKKALQAFESDPHRVFAADGDESRHIGADMDELGLDSLDVYWDLVYECIQIALENPSDCFRQPHPPKIH